MDQLSFYRDTVLDLENYAIELPTTRFGMELLTHYSQCLFMLGIAAERCLLICHAARAKQLLSFKKRVTFCSLLAAVYGALSTVPAYALYLAANNYNGMVSVTI